ncbi:MAG: exopolyphosphatase [Chitinophagales bacterium]|nr:exopolyphosphatase [Bacteroidota bacterium]MCB9043999.1 exopolyphosphatase [Chitinophagales bacterium]
MKLAAIDIGSNAVRLLIKDITRKLVNQQEEVSFQKDVLVRVPLRLGEQVFNEGFLFENKIQQLIKTMDAFRNLMEVYGVLTYKACATSAMRDAKNGGEVVNRVQHESRIDIEIIDGIEESQMLFAGFSDLLKLHPKTPFINIDVGGGSTEFVVFYDGKIQANKSFNIGTIRLLYEQVEDSDWAAMEAWLSEWAKKKPGLVGLGSGGNINKIRSMYLKNKSDILTTDLLDSVYEHLSSFTLRERIIELGLKPDRADVIVPASIIYKNASKWAGIRRMYVPQIGVSDGIIHYLYDKLAAENKLPEI